jgi:ribose transport system permease protein
MAERTDQDIQTSSSEKTQSLGGKILSLPSRYFIQTILVVLVVILSLGNEYFHQVPNIRNILLQSSFTGIAAAGMTLLIMSGAFDLSVGGMLGMLGVLLAMLTSVVGLVPSLLITLVAGALFGILNGLIVTRMKIPAFIATLGMMNVYFGLAFIITNAQVIPVAVSGFRGIATNALFGLLPSAFIVMVVVYAVVTTLLRRTTFGRFVRAIGSNQTAAAVAGVDVDKRIVQTFMTLGICVAVAAIMLTAMLSSANAIMAQGFELQVIATVVVGGTSLKGGTGTLAGTFTGALLLTVINNALNIFGVEAYWQYVVAGAVLIVAISIQMLRVREESE